MPTPKFRVNHLWKQEAPNELFKTLIIVECAILKSILRISNLSLKFHHLMSYCNLKFCRREQYEIIANSICTHLIFTR